jgi:hypothetical protein
VDVPHVRLWLAPDGMSARLRGRGGGGGVVCVGQMLRLSQLEEIRNGRERSQSGELEGGLVFIYRTLKRGEKKTSEIKNDRHRARFGYMMDNSKKQGRGRAKRQRETERETERACEASARARTSDLKEEDGGRENQQKKSRRDVGVMRRASGVGGIDDVRRRGRIRALAPAALARARGVADRVKAARPRRRRGRALAARRRARARRRGGERALRGRVGEAARRELGRGERVARGGALLLLLLLLLVLLVLMRMRRRG